MTEGDLAMFARDGFFVLLRIAGPVLLAGLAVGLAVSLLQALTQIHENTLSFIPKLIAVCATIALLGGFMMQALGDYARDIFEHVIAIGLA